MWLIISKIAMAGFLTALPLTTLLALAFSQVQWGDAKQSVAYAKSIFIAIPISLLFFAPFLLAEKTNWGFWINYGVGISLLVIGYFIHKFVVNIL